MIESSDVERVLGYLRTDEAEIRATKTNLVWADTMARAADLIRALCENDAEKVAEKETLSA
jgi:hypothetical protein